MGQRKMSEVPELTATAAAERLLPPLKEYAEKLAAFAERSTEVLNGAMKGTHAQRASALEFGRLICLHDTLEKPVTELAREASGLVEHAALEHHLHAELKLRLDELEEHIRFASVMVGELIELLVQWRGEAERVRKLIEKSGRYKAPF
jgi:hypothetical protein